LPVLIGLLLAPLGAMVGTALFLAVFVGTGFLLHGGGAFRDPILLATTFYGLILGSVFGAPVTVIALPATYAVLHRRSVPTLARLTIAGALFGFVSVWIVTLLFWKPVNVFANWQAVGFTLAVAADGAAAGAVCGNLLARAMRSLQPQAWQEAHASPPA
jgi:hypothetical protein